MAIVAITCSAGVAFTSYRSARAQLVAALEGQVRSLAATAAASIDPAAHEEVRVTGRMDSEAYRSIERQLRRLRTIWRDSGIEVRFVYTVVRDPRSPSGFAYGVDAAEAGPEKSAPGAAVSQPAAWKSGDPIDPRGAIATVASDEYGEMLTGLAPILSQDGRIIGTAGVDIPLSSVRMLEWNLAASSAVAVVVVLALSLAAGAFVVKRIVGPVERLRLQAEGIASGDLTTSASARGAREVVALAESFASLQSTLRVLIGRVQEASVCANETCATLGQRAAHERDRARMAAANAVEAAGRAGQIASTARSLAEAAEDLRATGNIVVQAGTEGIENLRGIAGEVERLRQTGQALATQLEAMRERARAVDSLVEAMAAVADRSNLLSLNAEIEASKAGEAGRGFMVVATEIRRLAEQAAASALQIEGNVRRMHDAVDAGVDSTTQLAQSLGASAQRAQHGTELLTSSVEGIQSLGPRIAGIADASVQQRQGAEAISRAMGELAEAATNALGFFEAVEGMVADMKRRGGEMNGEVGRFRL